MKSKTARIIILFIVIALASLLFILWLVDFTHFKIPEIIPKFEARTYGVLILIAFILIFIFLQKSLLRANKQTPVWKLIIASTIVAFISLLLYQAIRQHIILRGQYSYDLLSVLLSSAAPAIAFILVAASVAIELKKVKGIWRFVPVAAIVILYHLTKPYLHLIE